MILNATIILLLATCALAEWKWRRDKRRHEAELARLYRAVNR